MIPPNISRTAVAALLMGVLAFVPQAAVHADQQGHGQQAKKHHHGTPHHADICAGFVVLPNGHVVLSAMDPGHSGMKHNMDHGKGHDKAGHHAMAKQSGMGHKGDMKHAMAKQSGMGHKSHTKHGVEAKGVDHLMGHRHGDDIPAGKDMTCVPIGDMASTSWTFVSPSPNLQIQATSLKGVLTHNSRANESLSLNVMLDGKPVEAGAVRLIARMPHHDHRMAGGHGPANDPDVEGLETMPKGRGTYTARMIDFSMGGPWFFEVHVQAGDETYKAYFASEVGEE